MNTYLLTFKEDSQGVLKNTVFHISFVENK